MSDDKKDNKKGESSAWKDVGWFALKTTAISGAVLGGTALALPLIGFTAGGVAAGSLAAGFQSAYLGGTIASGSAFAIMQSVGAAGLAASTQAAVVAGSAAVAGAHTALKKLTKNNETDSGGSSDNASENNDDEEEDVDKETGENVKNCEEPGRKTGSTNSGRESKKLPEKRGLSFRNDDPSNSLKLITSPFINDDSLDKWKDVELNENLTITQHLIKN